MPKRVLTVVRTPVTTALLGLALGCARVGGSSGGPRDGGNTPPAFDARNAVAQGLPSISNDASANDASASDGPVPGQVTCDGGATTSVSGTVFAPNGKLQLYNVLTRDPMPSGYGLSEMFTT
ncbi:MAG TPA: hypothetical protein VFH73_19480 [Polyangia bacterium]|jgi:hypothetical protein|nr:hypothetical protein [Polyangia bacterium]